jgi:CRP-like cAMP-binding protein
MGEHDRRHDPDQIVLPETHAVAPQRPRGESPGAHTGIETTIVQPDGPPKRSGFWLSLTTIERAEFLATAQEVGYPVGAVLWEEGQAADHTIVIKSGTVRVCVERDGRERIIAFRGPGDIIGERAALLLRRRSATIVAMETLHALRLTTQQFVTYLSNHPRVIAVMEREMYHRLTEQSGAMRDETGQYRPTQAPGAAAQYGSPQVYATAYIPIPAIWPCPAHGAGHSEEAASASWRPGHAGGVQVPSQWQPTRHMAITPSEHAGPAWAGQNCTIVFTDIAGFSSRVRNENDRLEVRRAMYTALRESFEESRVPWGACHSEDRGDGALIVVPPGIPTAAVIDPMIAALGMRLRRHNHRSSEAVRIQLRVALDVGPVLPDPPGVSGWALINAARLLEAAPFKEKLATTGADLGVIASRFVYDSVIAHSPGYVNADEYEPIGCRVKETDIEGWIHLRGMPARSAI